MENFNCLCEMFNTMKLEVTVGDTEMSLTDIVSEDICPLAFHSAYAYMITLINGGWFNWVGYNDHVIVHCPSPEGITMHVKAPKKELPQAITVEVIKANDTCYKKYARGKSFKFDFKDAFLYKLLDHITTCFPVMKSIDGRFECRIDDTLVKGRMQL